MLQTQGAQIVDGAGKVVRLRGYCIGGWMNMENFIDAFPGDEHGLRAALADILGPSQAQFFFDRWLDYFFAEDDVAYLKSCGANVVRLPLNYRHFENDAAPFKYLEGGFARLERAVQWCAKHQIYAILDLHSVQGWQNSDWHCDNASRHTYFWQHLQFQDRFVALWEELARRYQGNATIAGYNLMNEPVTNAPAGRFFDDKNYQPDWPTLNGVYERTTQAIRAIDPDHIIFLEGDLFSTRFEQLAAPFAANLVYSSHNYSRPTYDFRRPPISPEQRRENREQQKAQFLAHQGTRFVQKHQVPLWVGEFGASGATGLEDQISVFEEFGAHWTLWTYKDARGMGGVNIDPASVYMQHFASILEAKEALGVDNWFWGGWTAAAEGPMRALTDLLQNTIGDPDPDFAVDPRFLTQAVLGIYAASLMQPTYAKRLQGLSEAELDRLLQSFAFKNCLLQSEVMAALKKAWNAPA